MSVILVFFCIVFIGFMIRRYVGLTNITNPIVPLYYFHTVFFCLALLYKDRYDHIVISQQVFYMIMYGYFVLFSVAILANRLLGVRSGKNLALAFVNSYSPKSSYLWSAFILQTIVLVAILFFYIQKGVLVLADDADNYRVEARKGLGFLIVLFRWVSAIFVVICTLHIFTCHRKSKYQIVLFVIYYLITIVFMLGLGSRVFVLDLVVIVIAIYYWARGRDIDLKLVIVGLGFFAFIGLLGVIRQGLDVDALLIFEKAIWRPFVNIQNFQWIVNDFNNHEFLYGKSFLIELKTLLPGYQPNFGTWYKDEFGYLFSGGSITITYLGEAYSNLGFIGVLFAPVLIGFGLALVARIFQNSISLFGVFLSIMVSLSLKGVVNVGLGATIVGTLLPAVFCLVAFIMVRLFLKAL